MSDREEFEEWYTSVGFVLGESPEHATWAAWQAARASRWRSMESAPYSVPILMHRPKAEHEGSFAVTMRGVRGDMMNPAAWHPLPDPPTKEEVERLK